jgi:hypothetical protein
MDSGGLPWLSYTRISGIISDELGLRRNKMPMAFPPEDLSFGVLQRWSAVAEHYSFDICS